MEKDTLAFRVVSPSKVPSDGDVENSSLSLNQYTQRFLRCTKKLRKMTENARVPQNKSPMSDEKGETALVSHPF